MAEPPEVTASPISIAIHKGFQAGTSGALAMTIQVTSLMWLRTAMNYQYRYGTTTTQAMKHLWENGGVPRFYRGLFPALLQAPLSRFGDTAANVGILKILEPYDIPLLAKTGTASCAAGLWRIVIMPIDAAKTTLQVEGSCGTGLLVKKIRKSPGGILVLWHGSLAAASATAVGHFPWFYTFNLLQEVVPLPSTDETGKRLLRNACIGFISSVISDSISNSLRVVKTTRQTFPDAISYFKVTQHVIAADGILGLFGRGLKTRIIANGCQGLMFAVLWKYFMELQEKNEKKK